MEVTVQDNEGLERALRRFKRKVQRSGLYSELRKRRFYEKPAPRRNGSVKPLSAGSVAVSAAGRARRSRRPGAGELPRESERPSKLILGGRSLSLPATRYATSRAKSPSSAAHPASAPVPR